nr:hypothetical protein [Tanacetum cinerariifolium]
GRYDDQEMFDKDVLNDEEVVVEDINAASIATAVTAVATTDVSIDDITLDQALVEIKTSKPKARGLIIQEPSETLTTTTTPISLKVQDKRKARRLQAEIDEQDRLIEEKEKAQLIEDENLAWDNVQAMIDADYKLAARLQEEEQGELTIEEKSRLFMELIDKRKKHFAKLIAEEQRRKPPTKAQKNADYKLAARLQEEEQGELTIEEKSRLFMELVDKRKKHFEKLIAEEQRRKPPTKAQKSNQMCV